MVFSVRLVLGLPNNMVKLRCPVCRSRRWRKEPSSGMLVCSEGHILQGYRNETTEQAEIPQHAMRTRALKAQKKVTGIVLKNSDHLYGHQARVLYFQAQQLLFRLQIAALHDLWSLPAEFEGICKDVWSLHLMLLPNSSIAPHGTKSDDIPTQDSEQHSSDEGNSSVDEKRDIGVHQGDDLAMLLDNLSDASSASDEEGNVEETQTQAEERQQRPKSKPPYWTHSRPSANIAILVVACWIMRIPVIYADFIRLIDDYALPYLNPIERGLLPESMVKHMNRSIKFEVSPTLSPRPLDLHHLTSRLARIFLQNHRVVVPEANVPIILLRCLRTLHLPAVFYRIIVELADLLELPLSLHPSLAPNPSTGLTRQIGDNIPIEVALACVATLSLKLVYGLDGLPYSSSSKVDSTKLPEKSKILQELSRDNDRYTQRENRTASDLSNIEIDEYLDFCTRALLSNISQDEGILERIFRPPLNRADQMQPSSWPWLKKTDLIEKEDALHNADDEVTGTPEQAQQYRIYQSSDTLGLLPEEYGLVATVAARWCGVTADDIAVVVERYERRILRGMVKKSDQRTMTGLS